MSVSMRSFIRAPLACSAQPGIRGAAWGCRAKTPTLIRSIRRGYRDLAWSEGGTPSAEYNILSDIPAARAVFECGVPLTIAPLDATMVAFDELKRQLVFTRSTPVTDALALTYLQWSAVSGRATPLLFDVAALAWLIEPAMFTAERLRLEVDDDGMTRVVEGAPNADVLTGIDETGFFRWLMPRLVGKKT